MKDKGLVALLDGLLAYTIAFLAIGMITLLMVTTHRSDTDTSYLLNVWAEDIADVIGLGLVSNQSSDFRDNWRYIFDSDLNENISRSLSNISANYGLMISVDLELTKKGPGVIGSYDIVDIGGDVSTADQSAMAMRLIVPTEPDNNTQAWGNFSNLNMAGVLTIKLGKK